jgi:tetratricopeptide (TPR) repeat protein
MEEEFDALIKKAKEENSVISYLRLFHAYKINSKYYSAQQTLERCLRKVTPVLSDRQESEFSLKLKSFADTLEDFKLVQLVASHEFFLVYGLLGEVLLVLKKPEESLAYLINACEVYCPTSDFNRKFYQNVVLGGILEAFISVMMKFLYAKDHSQAIQWKENTDWLLTVIESLPDPSQRAEKVTLLLSNYFFILFTWYGRAEDFERCEKISAGLENPEVQFVLNYYKNRKTAKNIARGLVMNFPGISLYWTWLALAEDDYKARVNAVNKAISIDKSNWAAWVTLGIVQASRGDFLSAAKTWKVAHHFNHTDPQLWVLNSFLYKEAGNMRKSLESFKIACDLDPSLWLTIESYLGL